MGAIKKKEISDAGNKSVVAVLREYKDMNIHVALLMSATGIRYYVTKKLANRPRPFQYRFSSHQRALREFERIIRISNSDPPKKESYERYEVSRTLQFLLTPTKILVITHPDSPLRQVYRVCFEHINYKSQFQELRNMIEKNQIKNIVDLVEFCNFRPGSGSGGGAKMLGLELLPTKLEWHI